MGINYRTIDGIKRDIKFASRIVEREKRTPFVVNETRVLEILAVMQENDLLPPAPEGCPAAFDLWLDYVADLLPDGKYAHLANCQWRNLPEFKDHEPYTGPNPAFRQIFTDNKIVHLTWKPIKPATPKPIIKKLKVFMRSTMGVSEDGLRGYPVFKGHEYYLPEVLAIALEREGRCKIIKEGENYGKKK